MSLAQLEHRIQSELISLDFPARSWMRRAAPEDAYDVAIIGGGQSGLAAAFGLRLEQIRHVIVLDRAPAGGEGVWPHFARMHTLRTHKKASGLDFGNPQLTLQAWYTASFGAAAWEALDKVPTDAWHRYLQWYRRVLDLPVRNGAEVVDIVPAGDHVSLTLADGATLQARKVVLATGLTGSGRWHLPELASTLPKTRYAHTEEAIDFTALRGRRVGVLGGGASAFDNAATALEHGAHSVDLCIRLPALPRVNPNKWMETNGFLGHFHRLADIDRWRFMRQVASMNQPPPQETLWRCTRHANFALRTGSPWLQATDHPGGVTVCTPRGELEFDHLIFGTGLVHDLAHRPELASLAGTIATWGDRFVPPDGERDEAMSRAPYLDQGFQLTERQPGQAPCLRRIHAFNFGATLSQGLSAASISGMKFGVRRLVHGIVGDLFAEDAAWQLQSLRAYADADLKDYSPGLTLDAWDRLNSQETT
jgi:cation diffusion facilitator CzcD-associated flavoprotein CzcO